MGILPLAIVPMVALPLRTIPAVALPAVATPVIVPPPETIPAVVLPAVAVPAIVLPLVAMSLIVLPPVTVSLISSLQGTRCHGSNCYSVDSALLYALGKRSCEHRQAERQTERNRNACFGQFSHDISLSFWLSWYP